MTKSSNFKFKINYLYLTVLLFIIEVLIALFVHDDFIRPYVGDVLVVILIYCFLKIFWNAKPLKVAVSVVAFAFVVEYLQLINIVHILGLQDNRFATIVIGTSFAWWDLVAYWVGGMIVVWFESRIAMKLIPHK